MWPFRKRAPFRIRPDDVSGRWILQKYQFGMGYMYERSYETQEEATAAAVEATERHKRGEVYYIGES